MARILGIGDNTVDLYVDAGIEFPGGNAVNVAVLTARLGALSSYLGCVGTDAPGRLILDSLKAEGVDVSHCRRIEGMTSWSRIIHRGNDRVFAGSSPGVRDRYNLTSDDFAYIRSHDLAHSSVYSDLEIELPRIKAASTCVSFDFSEEWNEAYFERTLPYLDIALLSWPDRSDQECRELMESIAARGPQMVVLTRGLDGSMAYDGSDHYRQAVLPANVVDTLGAGDAFVAGFLVAWLGKEGVVASLRAGAAYAADACSYRGAFGYGIPIDPGQAGSQALSTARP